jgi:hypothetical protein
MKRYLANILLLTAALLCCGATTVVARAQEPCLLERAVAPDYGGVMLGMKREELARMFPGSEELQKAMPGDSSKPFVASLGGLELGVRKEQFGDVNELLLTFLNGMLHRIDVRYRQPVPWHEVTEFSAQVSKRLVVPAESWDEPLNDAEKQSRVLDCRGFSVVVRIDKAGPSTLSIVDTAASKQDAGSTAAPAKSEPVPKQPRPRKGRGGKGKIG